VPPRGTLTPKLVTCSGPREICDNEPDWLEAYVPLIKAIARKLERWTRSPANPFLYYFLVVIIKITPIYSRCGSCVIYHKRVVNWLLVIALICMISTLTLPTWSLMQADGVSMQTFNVVAPFGLYFPATSSWELVTDLSGGIQLAIATLLIMTVLTIILLFVELLILRNDNRTEKQHELNLTLIVSGILALSTPLTFWYLWPQGTNMSFWGSFYDNGGNKITEWGPGYGWSIQFIAFILIFIVIIIFLTSNKTIARKLER